MSRTDPLFMGVDLMPDSSDPATVDLSTDRRDATAARLGMVSVLPTERELFLDLDDGGLDVAKLLELGKVAGLGLTLVGVWSSKTDGHSHALIRTDFDLTPTLRCALQCALGSDRKRELLSLARILRADVQADPTVFFEKPDRARMIAESRAASTAPEPIEDDITW